MKHSPEPWRAAICPTGLSICIVSADGTIIAQLDHSPIYQDGFRMAGGSTSEQRADARLMATAPDLLKACEEMLEDLKDLHREPDFGTGDHRYQYAIDAIKKARLDK